MLQDDRRFYIPIAGLSGGLNLGDFKTLELDYYWAGQSLLFWFSEPSVLWNSMDLLGKHLKGCSPYIMKLNYDLEKREVILICAKSIGDWTPGKKLKFTEVTGFSEYVVDFEDMVDDNLTDSVMGLREIENGSYCLATEKRELTIQTMKKPFSEVA